MSLSVEEFAAVFGGDNRPRQQLYRLFGAGYSPKTDNSLETRLHYIN